MRFQLEVNEMLALHFLIHNEIQKTLRFVCSTLKLTTRTILPRFIYSVNPNFLTIPLLRIFFTILPLSNLSKHGDGSWKHGDGSCASPINHKRMRFMCYNYINNEWVQETVPLLLQASRFSTINWQIGNFS
jgi:hypothetical protein